MTHRVTYSPASRRDLQHIRTFIQKESSATIAAKFVIGLLRRSKELEVFPHQGSERKALRPGLRVIGYKHRASIHFEVSEGKVMVLRFFYAGRNWSDDYAK
jgi:toxin ParE1/3/4